MGTLRAANRTSGRALVRALAGAWLLALPTLAVGQGCDPALPRNDQQVTGYRPRGDRCEGVYKRQVASFGVQLVSLSSPSDVGDLCVPGQPVHMTWPAVPGAVSAGPIHLQAESLRQLLYYRLDADRPPGTASYEWPTDPRCSNDVRLTSRDVGLLARAPYLLGARKVDVLLPVGLTRTVGTPLRPPYQAVLLPGRRLREVYVSVWRHGNIEAPTRIVSDRPLSMRPYPPGQRVAVPLSQADFGVAGLYRVRTSVEFDTGEVEALEFYILHAG